MGHDMKRWLIRKPDSDKVSVLLKQSDLSPLCAEILVSRGYDTPESAGTLLRETLLTDPFLLQDMDKAVAMIQEAIENSELICVYGDYDCDGIVSTVMLVSYLEAMDAQVKWYIPEREEGYGMNCASIQKLADEGVRLFITVDNGVSAVEEAALIRKLGLKLIITDHHQPSELLPEADAVIDPHRRDSLCPFRPLCGAGVVLKLLAALDDGDYSMVMEQFADLAAVATIADIVPLVNENRTLVQDGLHLLRNTENPGLHALMEVSGIRREKEIDAMDVAFLLAPRINAAGRFGSPSLAVELLLTEDPDQALELAEELNHLNQQRKQADQQIFQDIERQIHANPKILCNQVLIFSAQGWHHGVIGIAAAKIVEKYNKPCILITEEGEESRGSARGVPDFSVFGCLESCADLLIRFGGHLGAGGFTIRTSDIPAFRKKIAEYASERYPTSPRLTLEADKILKPNDLTLSSVESLKILEPFGEQNKKPVFAILGAKIETIQPLSNGKHTKLQLNFEGTKTSALLFGVSPDELPLLQGELANLLVTLECNEFQGRRSVTCRVIDCRKHGLPQQKYFSAKDVYEKYMRGDGISKQLKQRIVPVREDLIKVYTAIPVKGSILEDALFSLLCFDTDTMNYCKLKFCLDIFIQLGLIVFDATNGKISRLPVVRKVDLETAALLQELRCL